MTMQNLGYLFTGISLGIAIDSISGNDLRRLRLRLKWRYKRLKRKMYR